MSPMSVGDLIERLARLDPQATVVFTTYSGMANTVDLGEEITINGNIVIIPMRSATKNLQKLVENAKP
jgi:hypothetical protein